MHCRVKASVGLCAPAITAKLQNNPGEVPAPLSWVLSRASTSDGRRTNEVQLACAGEAVLGGRGVGVLLTRLVGEQALTQRLQAREQPGQARRLGGDGWGLAGRAERGW